MSDAVVRGVTPPTYLKHLRFQFKVRQIREHVPSGEGCGCGRDVADPDGWALHVAEVLFPGQRTGGP